MNKYKRLIRDMGIFALGALGSKLITFLLLPLYTHILTNEEYGIADLIFTFGQLLLPVVSCAVFNGLLRYGLMRDVKCEDALYCATKVYIIGSIVAIVLTPIMQWIPAVGEWRWYLCAYVISSFAVSNNLVYLKVKDKNKLYAILSILQTGALVICNVVFLVIFNLGIGGYLLAYIVSNVLTAICAFIWGEMKTDLHIAHYNPTLMKAMILFSIPYILNDISWWAIHSSNKLLIEFLLDSAALGVYTTASKIPSLINVVSSIFTQAWGLSSIKEYDSSNDARFYSTVFNYFVMVISAVCICVISIIKVFMKLYVGEAFFIAWKYVPLLLLGAAFSAISSFAGSLLGAMKRPKNLMWTTFAAGIANVICSAALIPQCGLWGAAVGTLLSYAIVALLRLLSVKKHMDINYNCRRSIALVLLLVVHAILVSSDFYIGIVSMLTVVIYLCIIYKDIKSMYYSLRKKILINE